MRPHWREAAEARDLRSGLRSTPRSICPNTARRKRAFSMIYIFVRARVQRANVRVAAGGVVRMGAADSEARAQRNHLLSHNNILFTLEIKLIAYRKCCFRVSLCPAIRRRTMMMLSTKRKQCTDGKRAPERAERGTPKVSLLIESNSESARKVSCTLLDSPPSSFRCLVSTRAFLCSHPVAPFARRRRAVDDVVCCFR